MFSGVTIGEDLSTNDLNIILKNLYETNFFEDVQVNLNQSNLEIVVVENPIIQSIDIRGIKNKSLEKEKELVYSSDEDLEYVEPNNDDYTDSDTSESSEEDEYITANKNNITPYHFMYKS